MPPRRQWIHDDEVPVHATLCVQLNFKALPHLRREAHKPGSLYDALGEGCRTYLNQALGATVLHDPHAHPAHLTCKRERVAYEHAAQECNKTQHHSKAALEAAYYNMHQEQMDIYFRCHAHELSHLLAQQNTTDFWLLFWSIVESATSDYLKLGATEALKLKGRGKFLVKEWAAQPLTMKQHDSQLCPRNLPPQVLEIRRISHLAG